MLVHNNTFIPSFICFFTTLAQSKRIFINQFNIKLLTVNFKNKTPPNGNKRIAQHAD